MLVGGALSLKKKLKAIDELPHNGIMSDMIRLTHKRAVKGGPQSTSVGRSAAQAGDTFDHDSIGMQSNNLAQSSARGIVPASITPAQLDLNYLSTRH